MNQNLRLIERPHTDEYSSSSAQYIRLVPEDKPVLHQLKANCELISNLFLSLPPDRLLYRYAPNKWTFKEVLVHIIDDERIYAYRALSFARKDPHQLWGFDQDNYAHYSGANERDLTSIIAEYEAVRCATLYMYNGFPEAALTRIGNTNEFKASVRALLYHITGHEINHLRILHEKYLS